MDGFEEKFLAVIIVVIIAMLVIGQFVADRIGLICYP